MTDQAIQRLFAYGNDVVGGVRCPAAYVLGENTVDSKILERYDQAFEGERGTVPEDEARDAFVMAFEYHREFSPVFDPDAEQVVEELGWL